jgi:orotate phosphoribosyltransferase-like protein
MNDAENIKRFILLRAEGWSLSRISDELNVSKPTLAKWSRQHPIKVVSVNSQ